MKDTLRWLARTENGSGALVLRLILGLVMFPHGAQKLLGWFGGYGVEGTLGYFSSLGIPTALGVLVILIEFFGALALVVGALARLAALGVAAVMLGAVATVHLPYGFFMDWGGTSSGEGYEYHMLAIAVAVAIAFMGSGRLSVDRWIESRLSLS